MSGAVVALDQGSSSSRAIAFDLKGRVLASARRPLKTFYPGPGRIEHDPADLLRGARAALAEVRRRLGRPPLAIGLAAQRSTIVLWDRRDGRPVGRALSWQDGRAAEIAESLADKRFAAYEKTGLVLTPYYSAAKIAWVLRGSREARKLADAGRLAVGPVSTFLIWHLTRGEVFAADPTMAQRTLLFNLATLDWDEELLRWFDIPREILPEIRPSLGDWGRADGVPITAGLGDQQAAVLGLGARGRAEAALNLGTGAFFLLNVGEQPRRVPGLLSSVAFQRAAGRSAYLLEGTVHAAGTSLDWLREGLGLLGGAEEADKLCRASTHRVLSLNAIGGLGAPRWDYQSPAAFVGLTSRTRRADVVRGVVEGIAFLVGDIARTMTAAGIEIGSVRASGGLSRLDALLSFQADLLQLPVARCAEAEATALGAAALAAEGAGLAALESFPRAKVERTFKPRLAREEADRLAAGWGLFVDGVRRLGVELKDAGLLG